MCSPPSATPAAPSWMDIRKVNYVILGGDNAGEHADVGRKARLTSAGASAAIKGQLRLALVVFGCPFSALARTTDL